MKFLLEPYRRNIPDDELLEDLRRVAGDLNKRHVTCDKYQRLGKFQSSTLVRRFGSWVGAHDRAGLEREPDLKRIADELLYENLRIRWEEVGHQPLYDDMKPGKSRYSRGTYVKRFGSWGQALESFEAWAGHEDARTDPFSEKSRGPEAGSGPREISLAQRPQGDAAEEIHKLIGAGERATLEFKQSLEYVDPSSLSAVPDAQRNQKLADAQKAVLHSALKTICAFLNSKGGTLLLGIHDGGQIIGIEADFSLLGRKKDKDGFENKLTDILKARVKPLPTDLEIQFVEDDGKTICRIDAPADPNNHFLDNRLYVRFGNSTEELTGRELQDWLEKRARKR